MICLTAPWHWVGSTGSPRTVQVTLLTLFGDLVAFLVALHGLPLSLVGPVALPAGADLAARRRADGAVARDAVRRRWSSRDVSAFDRWLDVVLTTLARCDAAVFVHGDFWYGNLRVADGRLHGVLDWQDAAVTDPAVDLGPILYLGPDTFESAVRDYARRVRVDHRVLSLRARASCQARELSGIRACVSAHDERELESELLKLRAHL